MTVSLQFMTMLVMVGSGIYLGMALDTLRRLLVRVKKNQLLAFILEIVFWIVQACVLFYLLFLVNGGDLRLYIFLACLLGFSTYQALMKNSYLMLLEKIIQLLAAIFRFLYKLLEFIIWKPIKGLLLFILSLIILLGRLILFPLGFIGKTLFFPIYFIGKKIKERLPNKIISYLYKVKEIYSTIKQKIKK